MKKVKQTLKTDDLASSEGAGDQCIGELRTILETTHSEKSEEKVISPNKKVLIFFSKNTS